MDAIFRKSLPGLLALIFLQILAIAVLFPTNYVREAIASESEMIERQFDEQGANYVFDTAGETYKKWFKDTGIESRAFSLFSGIDAADEGRHGPLYRVTYPLRPFLLGWFETLFLTAYLFLLRISESLLFAWLALLLFVPSVLSGILGRKITQNNFDYVSPVRQKGALLATWGSLYLSCVVFALPVAVSPYVIATVIGFVAFMPGIIIRHLHKRV